MKKNFMKTISLGTLAILTLGACSSSTVPESYIGALSFPKNEVEMSTVSHTINFGMGGTLSENEKQGLLNFLAMQGIQYGDQLVLDFSQGDAGWGMKLDAVTGFLKTNGYWVKYTSQSGAVRNGNQAVLNVNKYAVVSPDCQGLANSSFKREPLEENLTFGCVTAYNLGLMVANPQDLIEGQPDDLPTTYRAVRALQLYRGRVGLTHLGGTVPIRILTSGESADEQK